MDDASEAVTRSTKDTVTSATEITVMEGEKFTRELARNAEQVEAVVTGKSIFIHKSNFFKLIYITGMQMEITGISATTMLAMAAHGRRMNFL